MITGGGSEGATDSARRRGGLTALLVAFAAGELALSLVGVHFVQEASQTAAWWPAAGLAVAAMAMAGRRYVPLLAVLVVLATGLGNYLGDRPLDVSAAFGVTNAIGALVTAAVFTRGFTTRARLDRLEDCARLFVAAVIGAVASALGAAVAAAGLLDSDFLTTLRAVTFSHATAILLIVPAALLPGSTSARTSRVEVVAQWVTAPAVAYLVFRPDQHLPLTFLVFPVMVWAALRSSPRVVGWQLLTMGSVIVYLSTRTPGPFPDTVAHGDLSQVGVVVLSQALVVGSAMVIIPLSVGLEQRRHALAQVRASEELFRSGFDESLLGMLLLRQHGSCVEVVRANDVAARLLGLPEDAQNGVRFDALLADDSRDALLKACSSMASDAVPGWHDELALSDGSWVEVSLAPLELREVANDERVFSAQMVDITQRRQVEGRLTELTLHDSLTGLPNRLLLADRIEHVLSTADEGQALIGLLLVDLDNFKLVNDATSHSIGDAVLVEVAKRLVDVVRPGDTVARIGGDEFVIVSASIPDGAVASSLAQRVTQAVETPIEVEDSVFTLSASIGIAVGSSETTVESLLRDADTAMNASKSAGKRRATMFTDEHRHRAVRTVQLERSLRRALDRDEFLLHVQPIVDLETGLVVAGETLIRWQHPERGLLLPRDWLDVAEQSSLIHELGQWVLEESCRLAVGWCERLGDHAPAVHVNVSARQLDRGHLVERVHATLDSVGLPGSKLVLELTETQLEYIGGSLRNDLAALRQRGVTLAADDFGTGYSPLTRVTDLPLDMLKIDRQFVIGLGVDPRATAVVQAVLGLGSALGFQLVAEGVETPAQAATLRAFGCVSGQGYLWSPPRPPESFLTLLRTQRRDGAGDTPTVSPRTR